MQKHKTTYFGVRGNGRNDEPVTTQVFPTEWPHIGDVTYITLEDSRPAPVPPLQKVKFLKDVWKQGMK